MNDEQALALGELLRTTREALGLSTRTVAKMTEINQATIQRFELGQIAAPAPDKLARVAEVLGLSLADVYAHAGYSIPSGLPSFTPYLRAKYQGLPAEDIAAIERYAARLAKKHGINLQGPAPGEDEA